MKELVEDLKIANDNLYCANKMLEKEIERLNKKIEQYENPEDMTLMFMWCDEKAKDEIKRLNKELQDTKEHLGEYLHEQEEENKRLNNIINELEKWLEEQQINSVDLDEWTIIQVRDKILELKGSESNGN